MRHAIDDIGHRHREHLGIGPAKVLEERDAQGFRIGPGELWLDCFGPVFVMLRLISDCTLVVKVSVLFVSSPSGMALFGSAMLVTSWPEA